MDQKPELRHDPCETRRVARTRLEAEDVDGAVVFRQACGMGLEGIVAKRRDSRYHSGRSRDWIKIKNMAHPAIERAMLIALGKSRRNR